MAQTLSTAIVATAATDNDFEFLGISEKIREDSQTKLRIRTVAAPVPIWVRQLAAMLQANATPEVHDGRSKNRNAR